MIMENISKESLLIENDRYTKLLLKFCCIHALYSKTETLMLRN